MIFRPAIHRDCEYIVSLHVEISREAYSKILSQQYLQEILPHEKEELWARRFANLDDPNTQITVMEHQGEVSGFLCFQFDYEPQFGTYLHNLYVVKGFRGGGHARSLIRAGIDQFSDLRRNIPIHLVVFAENETARRLYDRLGGTMIEHSTRKRGDNPPVEVIRYQWESAACLGRAT